MKRRYLQFRLRSLLALLLLAGPLAFGAEQYCRYRERCRVERERHKFDELIELITKTIRPSIWDDEQAIAEPGSQGLAVEDEPKSESGGGNEDSK